MYDGVTLVAAGVPYRTAQRSLSAFCSGGLAGLEKTPRSDKGGRKMPEDLARLVEGLALRKPLVPLTVIHRQAAGTGSDMTRSNCGRQFREDDLAQDEFVDEAGSKFLGCTACTSAAAERRCRQIRRRLARRQLRRGITLQPAPAGVGRRDQAECLDQVLRPRCDRQEAKEPVEHAWGLPDALADPEARNDRDTEVAEERRVTGDQAGLGGVPDPVDVLHVRKRLYDLAYLIRHALSLGRRIRLRRTIFSRPRLVAMADQDSAEVMRDARSSELPAHRCVM